ncbi:abortive infection family protein [Streptomyces sp. NPDC001633]|uniref:abortive infection family protein n=1 Tax=Streptomyces sp. NPDC001633 TaxID=3364595 RepID=UPI003693F073
MHLGAGEGESRLIKRGQLRRSMPPQRITEVTRRRLLDLMEVEKAWWWGALDEVRFLQRLYDLDALPSTDHRYTTAREDIIKHCLNNEDWLPDWIFTDDRFRLEDDETLLRFLAETLHPVVRRDRAQVEHLVTRFNEILAPDGFELYPSEYLSGLPLYAGGCRTAFHGARPDLRFEARPLLTDPRVLHEHQNRVRAGLQKDPAAAIASCKELVESLCKIILERQGIDYPSGEDLPALFKRVTQLLGLNVDSVPEHAKASGTVTKILRTLTTTVQGLAELRNQLGLGHGRAQPSPAFERHARLALNSTVAVTEFLLDTWHDRMERGALNDGQPH